MPHLQVSICPENIVKCQIPAQMNLPIPVWSMSASYKSFFVKNLKYQITGEVRLPVPLEGVHLLQVSVSPEHKVPDSRRDNLTCASGRYISSRSPWAQNIKYQIPGEVILPLPLEDTSLQVSVSPEHKVPDSRRRKLTISVPLEGASPPGLRGPRT